MDKLDRSYIWHVVTMAKLKLKLKELKGANSMFERKRHLKEVIETKSKQIANRDKLIDGQRAEIHQWQEENKTLYNENKNLKFEKKEFKRLFERVKTISESNNYNNSEIALNKIKELVKDFEANY